MLLGYDEQCQAKAIEHCQCLVQAYAALAVFEPRHQIDRYAEQSCCVIDTQLLSSASLSHQRTQLIGGNKKGR